MLQRLVKDEAGFTLIELLIVVVIIGILAAVGVPIYSRYIYTAKASEAPTIIGALVEYAESYARAHPELVSSTGGWGMLGPGNDTSSLVAGSWVAEVVGSDNEYFNYYYDEDCSGSTAVYSADGTPCLYAAGKGGASDEFDATDELVYFLDPGNNGTIGGSWWSGADRLLDIVPD